jgi:hypothetical protein
MDQTRVARCGRRGVAVVGVRQHSPAWRGHDFGASRRCTPAYVRGFFEAWRMQTSDAQARRENGIAYPPPRSGEGDHAKHGGGASDSTLCCRCRGYTFFVLQRRRGVESEAPPTALRAVPLPAARGGKSALTQSRRTCKTHRARRAERGNCWQDANDRRSR